MIDPDFYSYSPNTGGPMPRVWTLIIHCTRSGVPMNPTEFEGTLNYMSQRGTTSSHWVIARDGIKARVVGDNLQAWHAGEDNDNAWGIELEQGVESDGFTLEQIAALVDVCRCYCNDFGVPPVHVHSSAEAGFVGHEETVQGKSWGKTDPGDLFPWDDFIAQLQPQSPAYIAGIGIHYANGQDVEVWNESETPPGTWVDGIGMRLSDGTIQTLFP